MLGNLFIVYANESFRDNPKNLFKVFDEIYPYTDPRLIEIKKRVFKIFLKDLLDLSEDNDPKKAANQRQRKYGSFFDQAYEAVYQYRNGYCPVECINLYGINFAKIAESLEYGGNRRLKCFECWQLYFRNFMTKLVAGENLIELIYPKDIADHYYKTITETSAQNIKTGDKMADWSGLDAFIRNVPESVCEEVVLVNDNELKRIKYTNDFILFGETSVYPTNKFNEYIAGLVGYSLTNFLLNNERTKLKQCRSCDKFFIAGKNDTRIKFCPECSPKSKKSKAEKAEYQKQYRLKKKEEKMAEKREARIKNMIQRTGYSREEVIEIIEADSMV